MTTRTGWTRQQLLVAFNLYCQTPFGKMHFRNPDIIKYAELIGRTPSALAMKLANIASLDPAITSTGRKGLEGASATDKAMWQEMQMDWEKFAIEIQQAVQTVQMFTESETLSGEIFDDLTDYTGNNKLTLKITRIGQDFFRRTVLSAYNYRCCISGLAVSRLLVASHIVYYI